MSRPCIFCAIASGDAPASRVLATDSLVAFMDIYPMRVGHVLVVPRTHAQYLRELESGARGELFDTAARIGEALRRCGLPCDDVNIVLNDGPAANQTVPHAHVHVIPRRRGDLPMLLGMLARRPFEPLLGGRRRDRLDADADAIARHIA